MIGKSVSGCTVIAQVGEGAMGAVYCAVDRMTERPVAVKKLKQSVSADPEMQERFRKEAIALAKLNHANIATLYSFVREAGEEFMLLEYIRGISLESSLRRGQKYSVERAVSIIADVLSALDYAHSLGVLHRDIKAANILLDERGRVKVTDFGIARVLNTARLTREGAITGTFEYMAPERILGKDGDARSDLYSTAVLLFELLCGRLPFDSGTEFEIMRKHLESPPPSPSGFGLTIPPALEAVLQKALAKKPEDRFDSAASFRQALLASVESRSRVPAIPRLGWSPALAASSALLLLLLGTATVWKVQQKLAQPISPPVVRIVMPPPSVPVQSPRILELPIASEVTVDPLASAGAFRHNDQNTGVRAEPGSLPESAILNR